MADPRDSATILVADDREENRTLLHLLLQSHGFKVLEAEDGRQAMHIACNGRAIDLALLDVVMPGADGFEVCKTIKSRAETRLTPVVLVTGLSAASDRIRGIECGADDFLSKPIHTEELLARVRSLLKLKHFTDELENAETVLFSLAASIEAKDPYTNGHCERLSAYSVRLAERLGLPEETKIALRRAGIVHDVGKVAVPEHILLKPGKLTLEERHIMEQHPVIGERICAPLKSFRAVLPIIRHHHEKMNGSGYPDRLQGEAIPLAARVLTVVDVYDSLTTERPYRGALPIAEALRIMREEAARGWWDRQLVEEFAALRPDNHAASDAPERAP